MFQTISRFIRDESGATVIEYGLIAALISVSAISTMQAVGGQVGGLFALVKDVLLANS
ncbi:MAG: Flp family type IVb pilin [Rhodospirillales bacterium]|nr:Flp family type IVb pilin [Rhodospirillales bacterium]